MMMFFSLTKKDVTFSHPRGLLCMQLKLIKTAIYFNSLHNLLYTGMDIPTYYKYILFEKSFIKHYLHDLYNSIVGNPNRIYSTS